MADETEVADPERELAEKIPATFSNRAYVSVVAGNLIRIAFAEFAAGKPVYRGAFILSAPDAKAVAELVVKLIAASQPAPPSPASASDPTPPSA